MDYVGTNGNDSLKGTAADDKFTPKLGHDSVSGGGGNDLLSLDYSSATSNYVQYDILNIDASAGVLNGQYSETDDREDKGKNSLDFQGIHSIRYMGAAPDDYATVSAAAVQAAEYISLDGGAGHNLLQLNLTGRSGVSFVQAADGSVTTSFGTFSNWGRYGIALGSGDNHLTTGDGMDRISAGSGTNTIQAGGGDDFVGFNGTGGIIDGGDGFDELNVSGNTINLDEAAGTLNGTTIAGFESFIIDHEGAADSTVRLNTSAYGGLPLCRGKRAGLQCREGHARN